MHNFIEFQIILFIIFILNTSSNLIVIPFKILKKYELNNTDEPYSFIENNIESPLYTDLLLGEPTQKITSIISFNVYELSLYYRYNNSTFNKTLYNRNNSKTFELIDYKNPNRKVLYLKEQVTFYNDINFKNIIKVKDLLFTFIEPQKKKKEEDLCTNIGLQLHDNLDKKIYDKEINTNIIMQLKQKNIISSYSFNIHFQLFEINKENFDGFLILGEEPHQYLKNSYNEYQLFKTLAFKKDKALSWDMHFNKVYYLRAKNFEKITDKNSDFYNQGTLNPNSNLIIGTLNYELNIKFDYFYKLLMEGKCVREINHYTIFYYCYKNKITKEDIENFPTLYFSNLELDYEFELNYKDLFIENGNLIYFLIIFYDFPEDFQNYFWSFISRWEFGLPFMKKYFFTYDYDGKYIGFYNNKKLITNNNNEKDILKNKNKNFLWTIIIPIIIVCVLIILYIRKYLLRNKRITAIELENNNINNINNDKEKYNYYNLEMNQKILH